MNSSEEKYSYLLQMLQKYKDICIAFSGGVDSTILLHAAEEALGGGHVTALHLVSTLCADRALQRTRNIISVDFETRIRFIEVEISPLEWPEFVSNDPQRCYFCKKRMYTKLYKEMENVGCRILADGTNHDDLHSDRPGLKALRELEIKTPLVDAGLTKREIRELAYKKGLSNHDLPSNSCLATRISTNKKVTEEALRLIERAEAEVEQLGFHGSRVKVYGDRTILEVNKQDIAAAFEENNRNALLGALKRVGLSGISLSLEGRE